MRVVPTRIALAGLAGLTAASALWLMATFDQSAGTAMTPIVAVLLLVCVVFRLIVSITAIHRGEVTISNDAVIIRYVLAPRRMIAVGDLDHAVLFHDILMPSRSASGASPRLVLRLRNGTTVAVSPRDAGIGAELVRHGVTVQIIREAVTPARARKLSLGSVRSGELLAFPAVIAIAIVLPVAAVAWLWIAQN
ncbi:hypothetical protein GCM10009860_05790 [Microbacterium mitrae]|uniref:PH domain-containing protein n=1 Tax=Microbacterium mitrae TaxID=664640 RepID=A0A5C8HSC3_9MICO|nr:hypothetical protein [Microbacterium mitrae]TXK05963.1 hypothetical protein FVP60_03030 [Microbacterium mitrae]